jgi:glucose-1-phosphate thymidylyltransferase
MRDSGLAKAVVLAAGSGRRMRRPDSTTQLTSAQEEAAEVGHKAMMPVGKDASRPFLDYILSALADAGCYAVCIVIGRDHDAMQRYYGREHPPTRIRVEFARQDSPEGTAHALLTAEAFAGTDDLLVLNADNLYPVEVLRALVELNGPGLAAFERDALIEDSGFPIDRVGAFALLDVDPQDRLRSIVEKPGLDRMRAAGPRALVSMNVWRFDHRIFEACRMVPRSSRGEYELPEAVALALSQGVEFRAIRSRGPILDLSRRSDVAYITERLADRQAAP